MSSRKITFGVLDDFLEAKTLLFVGDHPQFGALAQNLLALTPSAPIDVELGLDVQPANSHLRLVLAAGKSDSSTVLEERDHYRWEIGPDARATIAEQLRVLAESTTAGHQYLETGGEIQVIASAGEYPDEFLQNESN